MKEYILCAAIWYTEEGYSVPSDEFWRCREDIGWMDGWSIYKE